MDEIISGREDPPAGSCRVFDLLALQRGQVLLQGIQQTAGGLEPVKHHVTHRTQDRGTGGMGGLQRQHEIYFVF